mmetsp:Transcript_18255/g.46087  ORF Transcript_18255/g.46087 Transcript_18255/m.46087 type:complete len:135 (-) Transcript_18255:525-929(-)
MRLAWANMAAASLPPGLAAVGSGIPLVLQAATDLNVDQPHAAAVSTLGAAAGRSAQIGPGPAPAAPALAAPAAAAPAAAPAERIECCVCLSTRFPTRFVPCGHAICCRACTRAVRASARPQCPFCDVPITGVQL